LLSNEFFPLTIHQNRCRLGWGFAPDLTGGVYSAPPDPLAGFKGPLRGRRGMERREGRTRFSAAEFAVPQFHFNCCGDRSYNLQLVNAAVSELESRQ